MTAVGQLCNFGEKKVADALFGGAALGAPATWFIGLYTDAQGQTAAKVGGAFTEVASTNNYSRLSITNNTTNFPAATGTAGVALLATKTAAGPFTFPTPSGSWGTVQGFFLADAATGGNIWYFDDLTAAQTIGSGNVVSFANGTIVITVQ